MIPEFSHLSNVFSRRAMTRVAVLVLLVALVVPIAGYVGAVGEEETLKTRYTGTGSYGIAAWGVGMLTTGEGDIPLNVPGTVVQAYLYWSTLDDEGGLGDNQVTLTVDPASGTPTPINVTADVTYGPAFWGDPAPAPDGYTVGDHFVYVTDITTQILTGTHTYRVSDLSVGEERYGAGIVVVYSDPSIPPTTIDIRDGLDSFFWGWGGDVGPNSLANCVEFASSTEERLMDFAFLGAGVTATEGDRPDNLWAVTGSGTPPTELINPPAPGRYEINHQTDVYPFDSHVGPQFDVLTSAQSAPNTNGTRGVIIPAGDTYACFQVESDNSIPGLSGASMVWLALATALREPQTPPQLAALGDRVWQDLNNNGVQDAGEPGVQGVTVNLYLPGSTTPLATTTTDPSGNYLFSNLEPRDYQVQFVPPTGYNFTSQDQGGDDAADSDADPTTGYTQVIALAPGQTDLTWDAGLVQPTQLAAVGDYVWEDLNNNGVQDSGEPGIPGVTVNLYTSSGTFVATTTTDASGLYLFSNLQPGDYQVEFVPPAGYDFVSANVGTNDGIDSDADTTTGRTVIITLAPGQTDLTWDAGLYRPSTPPTVQLCYDIPSVGSVGAGQSVTYTLIIRNPTNTPFDPAIAQQTINTNVFTSIVNVVMGRGTFTVQGPNLVMNFGSFGPTDVVQVLLTLQADPNLGDPVNNPDPFLVASDTLFVCGQPQPTSVPGATVVPTVDVEQITALPATGYPPVAESSSDGAVDVRLLALAALALTAIGALVLTRRKAH